MSTNQKSKIGIVVVVVIVAALAGVYLKKQGSEKSLRCQKLPNSSKQAKQTGKN